MSGWNYERDLEMLPKLVASSADVAPLLNADPDAMPEVIDPRKWHRQETQQRNDCQGFASSSADEASFLLETGSVVQFSPHFAYITAQNIDGIRTDSGSTISGGVEASMEVGACPLDLCPYPASYTRQIPRAAYEAAANYRIQSKAVLTNYDAVRAWIGQGAGGVVWGIMWRFEESSPFVCERFIGGQAPHATAILGYSERKDRSGRPYLWVANSGWPRPGFYEVSPDAVNRAAEDKFTMIVGRSGMAVPAPRPIRFNPLGV